MAENRGYMQRYAMLFGTYMGGFWILKFILFPVGLSVPFLLFLFMGLTLCVPFMGYYYARMYRNQVCGGGISFLHAMGIHRFHVYVCRAACRRGTLHLLQIHRPRICDKHVRNDGRHACPKQHAGNGFVHRHLSGSSGDSPTAQPYRHYATDDIVQCVLGFDTGFPHRLVRDETQERRRSGRVTEQQKEMLFQL